MTSANDFSISAKLDNSGKIVLTFGDPEASLTARLQMLIGLKIAAHHALDAEKKVFERAFRKAAQGKPRKAVQASDDRR